MHTMIRLFILALVLWPALALAQAQPAAAAPPDWDKLSPAEREALIAPLRERWNKSPEQRARMADRAQRWRTMPPEQRDRARKGQQRWEKMTPKQREDARALFQAMRGMQPEQRKAFLDQWRSMSQQQRTEWLQAHPPAAKQTKQAQ